MKKLSMIMVAGFVAGLIGCGGVDALSQSSVCDEAAQHMAACSSTSAGVMSAGVACDEMEALTAEAVLGLDCSALGGFDGAYGKADCDWCSFKAVWDTVQTAVANFWNQFSDDAQACGEDVKDLTGKAIDGAKELSAEAKAKIKKSMEKFEHWFNDVVKGNPTPCSAMEEYSCGIYSDSKCIYPEGKTRGFCVPQYIFDVE